ncbi:keratin, type I cytoskeletal 19 [Anolis carolinensis]|uniref:IF rod domain-containing protein n=1 Tax=Anolis carolinensis TaxID=28377 RepID=A0A803T0X6_ANOCA|nr:PREDICTED: keratin, type I cytoskeletal 19 [Anolis carolinensis]|eukprot:XP_003222627.3 PREDICTED: keratin, type I cytoskeletal 19 [Anolis carolinensis]
MASYARHIPVNVRRNRVNLGSDGKSRISSAFSTHCTSSGLDRSSFPCQSHIVDRSPFDFANGGQGTFSSRSCSSVLMSGGGYGRRMSTGSCLNGSHGGYPLLGYGDGQVFTGGLGGVPSTCGIIFSSTDEKVLMQNLNDRLGNYIDKVRCLEKENAALESQISDFCLKHGLTGEMKDHSHFYQQIEELKKQVFVANLENNKILLKIDNNHMDLEDLRKKYETEYVIRENVEADVNGLRPVLKELTGYKADLKAELNSLKEEICDLKKTHEKDLNCRKKRSHGSNKEVSIGPGTDLKQMLKEMRQKYEAKIESNRKEVVQRYEDKLKEMNLNVNNSSQDIEDGNHKVLDLKCKLPALEIDLQAQYNMRDTLKVCLAEIECHFQTQLGEMQEQISNMEHQLAELHLEMETQDQEYKGLVDVKKRLEQEIQTYSSLLKEGQNDPSSTIDMQPERSPLA